MVVKEVSTKTSGMGQPIDSPGTIEKKLDREE